MILLIRAYQTLLSPVLPKSCVYSPSCSNYALEAYQRHGFVRGSRLTLMRLLRCWPWKGGLDPVPHRHHAPQITPGSPGTQPVAPGRRGS